MVMLYFPHPHGKKSSGPAVKDSWLFWSGPRESMLAASSPRALKEMAKTASQALSSGSDTDGQKISNDQDP